MPVIKRYSNRKLYDTESKRYVTLEDLADFIRHGEDIRVIDHSTGEDLTSNTLLQVIFAEERKIAGLLPRFFLARLIRTGGDTVNSLRSRVASLDPFQLVDEEIKRRIQTLVDQGRIGEMEADRFADLLLRRSAQAEGVEIPVRGEMQDVPVRVAGALAAENPQEEAVDPRELEALLRQIETLEQELQRMKET